MQIWDENASEKGIYKKGLKIASGFVLIGIFHVLFYPHFLVTIFFSGPFHLLIYGGPFDEIKYFVCFSILAFMILPLFFSKKSIVPWTIYFVFLWFLIGGFFGAAFYME